MGLQLVMKRFVFKLIGPLNFERFIIFKKFNINFRNIFKLNVAVFSKVP